MGMGSPTGQASISPGEGKYRLAVLVAPIPVHPSICPCCLCSRTTLWDISSRKAREVPQYKEPCWRMGRGSERTKRTDLVLGGEWRGAAESLP